MLFLLIFLILAALVLLISYICFRMAFYSDRSIPQEEYPIPQGEVYAPYRERMIAWMKETRAIPQEPLEITSFDGLKLRGRYFEYAPGATIELMFHGYRGTSDRDLCGGVQRCFKLGRNAILVDQRASGRSEGKVITFGLRERRDVLSWVDFVIQKFGPDVKIILTGISMGAATVMLAAGEPLPKNVIGVLADCGYTSARDIIQVVIRQMKLPPALAYPFVRLGAVLFAGFDPDADSPVRAMARCKVPVIFFHGEADDFVPCQMSRENYEACAAPKRLVTIPGAGHGLCCLVDTERYYRELREFTEQYWN